MAKSMNNDNGATTMITNDAITRQNQKDIKDLSSDLSAIKQSQKDLFNEYRNTTANLQKNTQAGLDKLSANIAKNESYTHNHIEAIEKWQMQLQTVITQQSEQLNQFRGSLENRNKTLQTVTNLQHRLDNVERELQDLKEAHKQYQSKIQDTKKTYITARASIIVAVISAVGGIIGILISHFLK